MLIIAAIIALFATQSTASTEPPVAAEPVAAQTQMKHEEKPKMPINIVPLENNQ